MVNNGVTTKTLTASLSLKDAMTIIGSNLATDGFTPEKHLNGQLEMLAYKDDVIDAITATKLFQSNHVLSVKTYVDILGRSKKDVINTGLVEFENAYSYKAPASGKTSLQVESIQKYDNTTVTYEYDELGNITSMVTPDGTYEYEYDYLNRLVREYNPKVQKTMIMVYKANNNIEFKKYYNGNQPLTVSSTPIESYEYKYENSWKDQLTSIVKSLNGVVASTETISYAGSNFIGNPSSICEKNLTWSGRRLTKITEANKDTIEYFYNEEGIRTKKKVGADITTYELNGSNIISETKNGTETIKYIYNERGLLVGFEHLSKIYYYVRDLLGITTEVVDENGSVMVSYNYDAWGKIIDKTVNNSSIDSVNHFVYKGYYLDNETEWYYLKSRYYNTYLSRFINTENYTEIKVNSVVNSNMFNYCFNNPIMNVDYSGNKWYHWVIGGLVVVGLAAAVVLTAGAAGVGIGAAFAAGFTGATLTGVAGASVTAVTILSAAFAGATTAAIIGTISGGITFNNGEIAWDWDQASQGFMWGAIGGAISGATGSAIGNIGNSMSKTAYTLLQGGINAVVAGSITASVGLVNGEFSWRSVAISSSFGFIGGMVGTTSWGEGIRNIIMGSGLGVTEASIGEIIDYIESKSKNAISSVILKLYLNY